MELIDDGAGLGLRVSVCVEGAWGAVSSSGWDAGAAEVVCNNTTDQNSAEGNTYLHHMPSAWISEILHKCTGILS